MFTFVLLGEGQRHCIHVPVGHVSPGWGEKKHCPHGRAGASAQFFFIQKNLKYFWFPNFFKNMLGQVMTFFKGVESVAGFYPEMCLDCISEHLVFKKSDHIHSGK